MTPTIQDTLLQLFEHARHNPDTLPPAPVDEWQLLTSFRRMLEQVQQRARQYVQMEQQLREQEDLYHHIFTVTDDGVICHPLDDRTQH
jgi:hypothetical protein